MHSTQPAVTAPAWVEKVGETVQANVGRLPLRLGVSAVVCLLFGGVVGWGQVAAWYAAVALFAFGQVAAFRTRPMSPAVAVTAVAVNAVSSAVYASIAVMVAFSDGPRSTAMASWLLASGVTYLVMAYVDSAIMFSAALAPFAVMALFIAFRVHASAGATWGHTTVLMLVSMLSICIAVAVWRDGSKTHRAEAHARAESERRRLEAERATAAKSAFMAVVSHELRTPINAILAGSSDLSRALAGDDAGKARLIAEAGAMMRTLLNDLLDKAKIDAGKMSVEVAPFDVRDLIADQVLFWRAEAERRGLTLVLTGAAELPAWISGDSIRLRQVLNNLLSNALKFTRQGQVGLEIAVGDGTVRFTVRDTGPGLSADEIARLFAAFEQTDAAHGQGGTGLGLAISLDLARLMGGELSVASAPGQGAAFTLVLPLVVAAPPAPIVDALEAELPPIRVLVVDDHIVNRRAMSLILGPLGVDLAEAASGLEALAILEQDQFDVVLMDCFMPGLDGKQTTLELRAEPGLNRTTPVIAVTGSTSDAEIAACRAAGMTDHVAKPIDPGQLIAAILRALEPEPISEAA